MNIDSIYMFDNLADQLWTEILKCLDKPDIQQKIRELAIAPIMKQLVAQIFPYFVAICVLFTLIIVLLIVVIYNQGVK